MFHACVRNVLSVASAPKAQKHMKVITEAGIPAQNAVEEKRVFRDHFCETMNGSVQSFSALVHEASYPKDSRYEGVDCRSLGSNLPAPTECLKVFKALVKDKGWGESRISTNALRCFADVLMPIWYPIYVKSYCRIQPPPPMEGRHGV